MADPMFVLFLHVIEPRMLDILYCLVVGCLPQVWEVVGSNPNQIISTTLKMVIAAAFLAFIYEVRTTKHSWLAWCQYNITGWGTMWACDMLSQ